MKKKKYANSGTVSIDLNHPFIFSTFHTGIYWHASTCFSKSRWPCCRSQWSQSSRSWITSKEGEWERWPLRWATILASWICFVEHTKNKTVVEDYINIIVVEIGLWFSPTMEIRLKALHQWSDDTWNVPLEFSFFFALPSGTKVIQAPRQQEPTPRPQLSWMTWHTDLGTVSEQACLGGRLIPASFSAVPSQQAGCHWTYRLLHTGQMWPFWLASCLAAALQKHQLHWCPPPLPPEH